LSHAIDLAAEVRVPLPRDSSVPIGCIGAGFIMSDCHLVAYRKLGLNPVAIASRRKPQAEIVARRHHIPTVYDTYQQLLADSTIPVIDVAVPPDVQLEVFREIVRHPHIRGVLAQKPLGVNLEQAQEIVELSREADITLVVNQNMRYDQAVRGAKALLDQGLLGEPVFASIDLRAVPHWMPWQQRQGWVTLRILSIHHLDTFRYWLGNPDRVLCSTMPDPRTSKQFEHQDGICLYILEYDKGVRAAAWDDVWAGPGREGAAADFGIRWRLEGTEGMAQGTIGWPGYPNHCPSTLTYTTTLEANTWITPQWPEAWFPDAFGGPMTELLIALETGDPPRLSGTDNLHTMALVEACYESAKTHQAVSPEGLLGRA